MSLCKFTLFAVLAACIQLSAAKVCNADVASPQSEYIGTFTWEGQARTVGSTSRAATRTATGNFQATFPEPTGSSSQTDLDTDAVNDVAFKSKRQSDKPLECLSNQVCLNNNGEIPFCVDERTGDWFDATGYEGNVVSGDYTTPDGQKGNILRGPCPGSLYEESGDGCALVSFDDRVVEGSSSASPTPPGTSSSTPTTTTSTAAATGTHCGEVLTLVAISFAVVLL